MAYLYQPPPTDQDLLQYVAKWVAQNQRAKVTIEVYKNPKDHVCSMYDYTPANKGIQPSDPEVTE